MHCRDSLDVNAPLVAMWYDAGDSDMTTIDRRGELDTQDVRSKVNSVVGHGTVGVNGVGNGHEAMWYTSDQMAVTLADEVVNEGLPADNWQLDFWPPGCMDTGHRGVTADVCS